MHRLWIVVLSFLVLGVGAKYSRHPVFDPNPEDSEYLLGWAKWSRWSSCTKPCGSGIQYQLRRCLDVHCSGPSSRYRICNTMICERETRTDAEVECSLKSRHSNGTVPGDVWVPVADPKRKCSLVCRSTKDGSVRDFQTHLRDGSRCEREPGMFGACLKGKCESLGCDFIIGSSARIDQCGTCGGDGKSCGKAIFVWKDTQQFSPCDKTCGPNSYRVSVSVCMNTVTNRVVPERLCGDQTRPRPQVRSCPHVVCPAQWLESEWSSCSVSCGGGIQTREVFCVESHSDSGSKKTENRKVDDHYCWKSQKPEMEKKCEIQECPKWVVGDWNFCSVSCGNGFQKRTVKCHQNEKIVDEIFCKIIDKPPDRQNCYSNLNCDNFKEFTSPNSVHNVDRYRFVAESPFSQWNDARGGYSLQEEPARLLNGFSGTTDKTKPKFYPGVWSECSASCGPGVRSRTVECVAFQGITSNVIKLPDYECEGEQKPVLFQPCQTQICPGIVGDVSDPENSVKLTYEKIRGNYRWDYGDWGPCSASCLGGKQKSVLKCIDSNKKTPVPWSRCDAKQRPVDLWRECNKDPCPPVWETGPMGECSHPCGGGIRTRKVRCVRQMAKAGGAESTLLLPDGQCPVPRPPDQEPCGLLDCSVNWRVEQWSPCSTSCGSGEQKRQIFCEKRTARGQLKVYDPPTECSDLEKPPTVQLCNLGPCEGSRFSYDLVPGPLLRPYSDDSNRIDPNFDQTHPNHRKLTLNVGGMANLYEGTSIKVKCPVKNFDRSQITWTKNGSPIENNAHIRVSSNGALRIFHARMEDAGLYACFGNGAQGNVTLRFKPRESDNSIPREDDTNRTKPKQPSNNRIEEEENEKDASEILSPNDVDQQLINKVKSSLERLGEHRFVSLLDSVREPGRLKVDFHTGQWSPCSQQECGKPDGAQVRLIKCRISLDRQTSAYVEDDVCDAYGVHRPSSSKSCHNPDCPEWEASDWTECSASRCIREGISVQRREIKCVFLNGTDADFTLCNRKTRPKIKKECLNRNCTAEWRPSIWGKCSKKCGDGGVQMRLLRCVWKGTKKAAGRNCDPSTRPSAIRTCSDSGLRPCVAGEDLDPRISKFPREHSSQNPRSLNDGICEDKSRFCDILKIFHSCDQDEIRARCCYSCHYVYSV